MNSLGTTVFVTSLVFGTLATFAVAGRLYCKILKKQSLLAEDWLVILSWMIALSLSITLEWGAIHAGVGYPQEQLPPSIAVKYLKVLFVSEILSSLAPGFSKLSVLSLYRRVFALSSAVPAINIAIALTVGWTIAFTLGWVLDLIPAYLQWSLEPVRPDRINVPVFVICLSVTGLALDLFIVALPIPVLRHLQTSKRRKAKYFAFFLLWTFCCAAAAVKIAYSVRWWQYNHEIGFTDIGVSISAAAEKLVMWALIESHVAIMAACIPTLGPLFTKNRALGKLVPKHGFRNLSGGQNAQSQNGKPEFAGDEAAGKQKAPNDTSLESRKWNAMWQAISGNANVTSVGHDDSEPLPGHFEDGRGGISVHQTFGTELQHISKLRSTRGGRDSEDTLRSHL